MIYPAYFGLYPPSLFNIPLGGIIEVGRGIICVGGGIDVEKVGYMWVTYILAPIG